MQNRVFQQDEFWDISISIENVLKKQNLLNLLPTNDPSAVLYDRLTSFKNSVAENKEKAVDEFLSSIFPASDAQVQAPDNIFAKHLPDLVEYHKRNPTYPELKPGRTKKDPVVITNMIGDVPFKLTIDPKDAARFADCIEDNVKTMHAMGEIARLIRSELSPGNKPRGASLQAYKNKRLVKDITEYSGILYGFLTYWKVQSPESYPNYLNRLIKKSQCHTLLPKPITHYCISCYFEKQLSENNTEAKKEKRYLNQYLSYYPLSLDNEDSFNVTYLQSNITAQKVQKLLKGKPPRQVSLYASKWLPLHNIFKSLNLL